MRHVQGRCQSTNDGNQADPIDSSRLFCTALSCQEVDGNHGAGDGETSG
jgi:hypothetical protein